MGHVAMGLGQALGAVGALQDVGGGLGGLGGVGGVGGLQEVRDLLDELVGMAGVRPTMWGSLPASSRASTTARSSLNLLFLSQVTFFQNNNKVNKQG